MRIWDVSVSTLCNKHLLGEHYELHAIWTYLTTDKGGSYRTHPETLRWEGKLHALWYRHLEQEQEMMLRNFNPHSPLPEPPVDQVEQNQFTNTIEEQWTLLAERCERCRNNIHGKR